MKNSVKNFYLIFLIFLSIGVNAQTPAKWIKIQTSNGTVMGLKSDSTLWAWGNNNSGIVGDSTFNYTLYPKLVSKDKKWIDFDLGCYENKGAFGVALCADSTIWTWGQGYKNSLGNENIPAYWENFKRPYPKILNNEKWISINYTSAIKKDNTLWVWGINIYDEWGGDKGVKQIIYPEKFRNSSDWKYVVENFTRGFGIKNDGSLWKWEYKAEGYYPNYTNKIIEEQIGSDKDWTYNKNWGLMKTDSTYWVWEGFGLPYQILPSNFRMKQITQYKGYSDVGIKTDGTLWAWGRNFDGFINKSVKTDSIFSSPVQIGTDNDWNYFSSGNFYDYGINNTIEAKGKGYCVSGANEYGQFGNGKTSYQNQVSTQFECFTWNKGLKPVVLNDTICTYSSATLHANGSGKIKWYNVAKGGKLIASGSSFVTPILTQNTTFYVTDSLNTESERVPVTVYMGKNATFNTVNVTTCKSYLFNGLTYLQSGTYKDTLINAIGCDSIITLNLNIYNIDSIKYQGSKVIATTQNATYQWIDADNNTPIQNETNREFTYSKTGNYKLVISTNVCSDTASFFVRDDIFKTTIEAGYDHNLYINNNQELYAWGKNTAGQLGDKSLIDKATPVLLASDLTWANVSAGNYHNLAIKIDGTLWAWGNNANGQLGNGTTVAQNIPVKIGTDQNWISTAVGNNHSLALKANGTLWAWGNNASGQLGINSTVASKTPVQIGSDTNWVYVSAGYGHSIAIKNDGTLWAWGLNNQGQLGDNSKINKLIPTQIGLDTNWLKVDGGYYHSLAIKSDSTLWTWGYNNKGQLGFGNNSSTTLPTKVGNEHNWIEVSAGNLHSTGLKSNNTIWAWGDNSSGQLGLGNTTNQLSPIMIKNSNDWVAISAGYAHTIALKNNGEIWVSGDNSFGQLGKGNNIPYKELVLMNTEFLKWNTIVSNATSNLGILSDGSLWSWGLNTYYPFHGRNGDFRIPGQISISRDWKQVAIGDKHALALKNNGTLWGLGSNYNGQLGNGGNPNDFYYTFTQINSDTDWGKIAAKAEYSLAIKTDHTLWAWGANILGKNNITHFPTKIGTDNDWKDVFAGKNHRIALKTDGTLWAWGDNTKGQFGDGTGVSSTIPIQINSDADWTSISTGDNHTLAIKQNGTLWAWGNNSYGQLGTGDTLSQFSPIQIGQDSNWVSITAGANHNLALTKDSSLYVWGNNINGQLGINNNINQYLPTKVGVDKNWSLIAAGSSHSIASKPNTILYCYTGDNSNYQFGNFTTVSQNAFSCLSVTNGIDEELVNDQIKVYPNPNEGKFTLEFNQVNVELKIFNIFSELIYSTEILDTKNEFDLSHYPNGIYLISLKSDKGTSYSKIVISK